MDHRELEELLGAEARDLLSHRCQALPRALLSAPGPDFLDRVTVHADRSVPVLRALAALFGHGALGGTD